MTKIEEVKTAIEITFAAAIDFSAPYAKIMLDMAAVAAIEAMREPTEEMVAALTEENNWVGAPADCKGLATWRAGIDAALAEKPE